MNLPYTRIFGGANKSNKSLAEEFARKGHDVIIIAPALATPSHITLDELAIELHKQGIEVTDNDGYFIFEIEKVKVFAVKNADYLRSKLIQKTKQINPDWVFISAEDPSQTLLNAAHEVASDKIIYLAHTPQMFPFGPESMYPGEKRTQVIGKSRLIVTISDFVANYIESNTSFKTFVNHPPHFGKGPYPNLSNFESGFVLTMNPCSVKGISIFKALAKTYPEIPFAVIPGWGTTPSDKIELERIPNITFLKNEPDLNEILKKTKILLMPTLWSEGFGMATVDAMLRGIPVIASNYGGLKEAKLNTEYSIDINPIIGFKDELDENSLPIAHVPDQNLDPWKNALEAIFFDKNEYEKQSQTAYKNAHDFINNLSIDKLENWLKENLNEPIIAKKTKIDINSLSPEQKKKLLLELNKKKLLQQERNRINPVNEKDYYDLSYAQKRLWILDEINDGYYGYIIPASIKLEGKLDKKILKKAFDVVINRHESLRTFFKIVEGEPRQFIKNESEFELLEVDFSSSESPLELAKIYGRKFDKETFDLSSTPLLKASLIKVGENSHILFFAMHHIISDGWSMKILTNEIYEAYLSIEVNQTLNLAPLEIHYKDFSHWQNQTIEDNSNSKLKDYWNRKLGGDLTVLNLPTDKIRPSNKTYNGTIINQRFDKRVSKEIIHYCQQNRVSVFAFLTTAVKILLYRYTMQEDIIIGSPTAGRNNKQLENQIGFYVNMLVIRDEILPDKSFEETLQSVNQTILEALEHEAYPFDKIVEDIGVVRDFSRSPIFDVMVSLDESEGIKNNENGIYESDDFLKASPFNIEEEIAGSSHDLAFLFSKKEDEILVNFIYNTDLFEQWKGDQILKNICDLTEGILTQLHTPVKNLEYIREEDKAVLLPKLDRSDWPKKKLIHQLFEENAIKYPENIALSFQDEQITYKELNAKANKIAHTLREKGVSRNTIVALLLERTLDMLVSILAILKAGGSYLPIDPSYPEQRINYTLSDSCAEFLIASERYDSIIDFKGSLLLTSEFESLKMSDENLEYINEIDDVAYIIYTSGSTGNPKGVMIMHYNVIRLMFNDDFQFDFNENDVWTLFHSYCFDFSVWEMYGALLYGGRLIVVPKLIAQSPKSFWNLLNDESVTVLNQTPSAFYNLIEEAKENPIQDTKLRWVIFGGDALNPRKLTFWKEKYANTRLVNMYGITETTVHVTFKELSENEVRSGLSNIGSAIPTLETYILDENQNLLPLGTAGELCVSGLGLAKGYLNNSELTEKKFINHPFLKGEKLYRSGDLAKLLPTKEMEYLGRIDFQVKIRGFRIELGEIESKLNQHSLIDEVLVIAKKDQFDESFLCAYYVSTDKINVKELRAFLMKVLPEYMVPSYFIHYNFFPLTSNGKIDRKALANPLETEKNSIRKIKKPTSESELRMQVLWNDVLNISESSIEDNFFEVGGHSLKANQLIGRIYKEFKVEIRLGEFFDSPSIEQLAELIDSKTSEIGDISIPKVKNQMEYEMSFAQKRMWVLDKLDSGSTYNMPLTYEIKGKLNPSLIEKAFNLILERHESLRTNFVLLNDQPKQIINDYKHYELKVSSVTEQTLKESIAKNADKIFDLSRDLLIQMQLLKMNDNHFYVLLNMHHIVSDGWSFGVFFKELFQFYKELEDGNSLNLIDLKIHYKDYANWQNNLIVNYDGHKKYWHEKLSGELPILDLPYKSSRPKIQTYNGESKSFELSEDLSNQLVKLSKVSNKSLFVVFQAFLKVLIYKYTGQKDILFGSPISGRIHPDLENQIGLYVNTLVFRDKLEVSDTLNDVLNKVNSTVIDGFDNQVYPFDLLVDELNIPRDLSRNPLFDVMVIMDEEMEHVSQAINDNYSKFEFKPISSDNVDAKFDLIFSFSRRQNFKNLFIGITYNTDLFRGSFIEDLFQHFELLVKTGLSNLDEKIGQINCLTEKDKKVYQDLFSYTLDKDDTTIINRFENVVLKHGLKKALVYNDEFITYTELDARINQLSNYLKSKNVQKGDFVCINLEPSIEYFVSIIAVLKCGGVYVPLDTNYPKSRIDFILKDAKVNILIDKELFEFGLNDYPSSFEHVTIDLNDPVYCIYTSGSTGDPKGVLVSQKAVLNLTDWFVHEFNVTEKDVTSKFAGTAFDVSVAEIFPFLLNGSCIHIIPEDIRKNPYEVNQYFNNHLVNIAFLPTQFCELFMDYQSTSLKTLITAGDALKKFSKNNYDLFNLYGPTENTVYSTFYKVEKQSLNIPIGKPVANTSAIVIDENRNLVSLNVKGELCLSGDNLATEYLNNEQLTNEKFNQVHYNGRNYYKTGDIARILDDGNIEFHGRTDFQVKIRGYRIELGEIDTHILNNSEVSESITIDYIDDSNEKILVNYYVGSIDSDSLKLRLEKSLPDYMVPARFIKLETMPLNTNGKIERKKLPEPRLDFDKSLVKKASTETEKQLTNLWEQIIGINGIGINQNFFRIGGNSLKSVVLLTKIQTEFKVALSLTDIFNQPTIEQLALCIDSSDKTHSQEILKSEKQAYYPLSAAQKRLYIVNQFEGIGVTYNMPGAIRLNEKLELDRFEQALNDLLERHEGIRTSFKLVDGVPFQFINNIEFKLHIETCTEEKIQDTLNAFIQPFDLSNAPLFRVKLLELPNKSQVLLYDMHHIIGDGFSLEIILRDLFSIYNGEKLTPLSLQYTDYSEWQKSNNVEKQKHYWLTQFKDELPSLKLPVDYKRTGVSNFEGGHYSFSIDFETLQKLKNISEVNGGSLFMTLISIYALMLTKISGSEEVVIGTPVAGRGKKGLEDIVGMFVNNLALKFEVTEKDSILEYLGRSKSRILDALENQDYQFEELVEALDLPKVMGKNPLFDTLFTYQTKVFSSGNSEELEFESIGANISTSKFDLTFAGTETANGIYFSFEYAKSLFEEKTIQILAERFEKLVYQVTENEINKPISEFSVLLEKDEKIERQFNSSQLTIWPASTLLDGFQLQSQILLENIAIVDSLSSISYKKLEEESSVLAQNLIAKGILKGDLVAILMDRNINTIIAMLGVMKSGACYVPIDKSHPVERINYYVSDSNSKMAIIDEDLFNETINNTLHFIELTNTSIKCELPQINPVDNAYMIYTSGSTGKPKGVKIRHESICNTVYSQIDLFKINSTSNYLQFASFSFDASITDIYGALLAGSKLFMPKDDVKKDTELLVNYCNDNEITIALIPPSLATIIDEKKFNSMQTMISGGEAINLETAKRYASKMKVFNAYGPTEIGVCCTIYEVIGDEDEVPIGRPIPNMNIYITDSKGRKMPIGSEGEICVSGIGVADSYYNRIDITNEKFLVNSFDKFPILYKTGDLGRINAENQLEYIGRIDSQVKIRGYRIELGEIEESIRNLSGIKNVVVTVIGESDKKIAAYLVSENDFNSDEIRLQLSKKLMDYMIPDYFIAIDEIPLTTSGKINKKLLPEPKMTLLNDIIKPQNEIQQLIWNYWSAVLEETNFGISNNFFQIGGNSLLAIKLVSKMSKDFVIKVNQLFENSTIEKLESVIEFRPDNVKDKLEQLREMIVEGNSKVGKIRKEKIEYLKKAINHYNKRSDLNSVVNPSRYENVLLTGGLGYLGIHILENLIQNSKANIYVLIRANSEKSGVKRLTDKLTFYFNSSKLFDENRNRVHVVLGDITQPNLGIVSNDLNDIIDCVVHAASKTTHYGEWEEFEKVNVIGVQNVIDFSERGKEKTIQYISTLSVASGKMSQPYMFFTEYDYNTDFEHSNYYIKSKIWAEELLRRKAKTPFFIYRVANLTPTFNSGKFQENADDNAFMNTMKFYFNLNMIPAFKQKIYDFSFVDQTADAINKIIFSTIQDQRQQQIFHLTNPNKISDVDMGGMIKSYWNDFKVRPILAIIDEFRENIDNEKYFKVLEDYIANSKVLESTSGNQTQYLVSSALTGRELLNLDFQWKKPNALYFSKFLKHLEEIGFVSEKTRSDELD